MKMNFKLCKKCGERPWFTRRQDGFIYSCNLCGVFLFVSEVYTPIITFERHRNLSGLFNCEIEMCNTAEMILPGSNFKECPYQLEHLVEG